MEEEIPSGNTERISSLYSYSQVLTEPVNFPGLPCRFNKAAAQFYRFWNPVLSVQVSISASAI